jgi:hypothetical protein
LLSKFIAKGINEEISSSLRQASKVFTTNNFLDFGAIKGSCQSMGIENLQ